MVGLPPQGDPPAWDPPCAAPSVVPCWAGPHLLQSALPGGGTQAPTCSNHCTSLPTEGRPCFPPGVPPFSPPSHGQWPPSRTSLAGHGEGGCENRGPFVLGRLDLLYMSCRLFLRCSRAPGRAIHCWGGTTTALPLLGTACAWLEGGLA